MGWAKIENWLQYPVLQFLKYMFTLVKYLNLTLSFPSRIRLAETVVFRASCHLPHADLQRGQLHSFLGRWPKELKVILLSRSQLLKSERKTHFLGRSIIQEVYNKYIRNIAIKKQRGQMSILLPTRGYRCFFIFMLIIQDDFMSAIKKVTFQLLT